MGEAILLKCLDAGESAGEGPRHPVQVGLGGVVGGPVQAFHSHHYLRHTARRQEHLASLRLPVAGMRSWKSGRASETTRTFFSIVIAR